MDGISLRCSRRRQVRLPKGLVSQGQSVYKVKLGRGCPSCGLICYPSCLLPGEAFTALSILSPSLLPHQFHPVPDPKEHLAASRAQHLKSSQLILAKPNQGRASLSSCLQAGGRRGLDEWGNFLKQPPENPKGRRPALPT